MSNYLNTTDSESSNPEKEIEVTICLSLSKTVPIKVTDYKVIDKGIDEDGNPYEELDFSDCDLQKAVNEQIYLPQEAGSLMEKSHDEALKNIADDFSGWDIDDYEVVQ